MNTVMDEFSYLMDNKSNIENKEEQSKKYIEDYKLWLEYQRGLGFIQGVNLGDFIKCISIETTKTIPWQHLVFTLDLELLQLSDAKKQTKRQKQKLEIPHFIEEIRGTLNNSTLGFNKMLLNNIEHIIIPSSVMVINQSTFATYRYLKTLEIEENSRLEYIGNETFLMCDMLKKIDFSNCLELKLTDTNLKEFEEHNIKIIKPSNEFDQLRALFGNNYEELEEIEF